MRSLVLILLFLVNFQGLVELAPIDWDGITTEVPGYESSVRNIRNIPIIGTDNGFDYSTTTTTSTTEQTTIWRNPTSRDSGDYVSDEQLQEVIDRLDREDQIETNWRDRFRNDFMDDDADIDNINAKIEQSIRQETDRSRQENDIIGQESERPYTNTEGPDDDICPICLESLDNGEKVTSPICSHRLHEECKNNWWNNVSIN